MLAHLAALEDEVVAQEPEADLGRVVRREHRAHAGQPLGAAGVDPADARVGLAGEADLAVEHPRSREVLDVVGAPGGLVGRVGARGWSVPTWSPGSRIAASGAGARDRLDGLDDLRVAGAAA